VSLRDFSVRMRRRVREVEVGVDRIVRETALLCDRELVLTTPVDTGRARSNWQVSVGAAETEAIPAYSEGEGGSTGAANAQAALDQGRAAVAGRGQGQTIFITNNLPYIGRLNDGYSAQAPAGFVQTAVQTAVEYVRNRARVLGRGN